MNDAVELLTRNELRACLKIGETTYTRWTRMGLPRVGGRGCGIRPRHDLAAVIEWLRQLRRDSSYGDGA
jgi:phage terminase Nu1 subunit (DNA packaging protein)